MSNQSDRPSTPDYQCDTDNIESRPIASSSNTLSQADRPGFVMSSQTDSGVESKLVVIDTGNITDKDSEHSHAVNERIAESKSWNDETPQLGSGHWLSSCLEFASYFSERLASMHMYYESTWGSFTGTRWNLNVRRNWNVLQRMSSKAWGFTAGHLVFHFSDDRGDVQNLFPTVFVWTTVFIGVSLTVLISWELVAFVMGIYT
ncbi:hypothetical protein GG344DRAFT_69573 [Lentinula edodes]|nr:hypothetical protein GG344DRAFT_69573 [Lentinula edodes]